MKHGNSFYLELTRELWTDKYKKIKPSAKWLFCTLCELEQRYAGPDGSFYFTNEKLAEVSQISIAQVKVFKKLLNDAGLINISYVHPLNPDGKKSEKAVTRYYIPNQEHKKKIILSPDMNQQKTESNIFDFTAMDKRLDIASKANLERFAKL